MLFLLGVFNGCIYYCKEYASGHWSLCDSCIIANDVVTCLGHISRQSRETESSNVISTRYNMFDLQMFQEQILTKTLPRVKIIEQLK